MTESLATCGEVPIKTSGLGSGGSLSMSEDEVFCRGVLERRDGFPCFLGDAVESEVFEVSKEFELSEEFSVFSISEVAATGLSASHDREGERDDEVQFGGVEMESRGIPLLLEISPFMDCSKMNWASTEPRASQGYLGVRECKKFLN